MLEQEYGFSRENIPKDLTAFVGVLQSIFGLGYSFLDSIFKSLLEQEIGEKLEVNSSFVEYVQNLRRNEFSNNSVKEASSILENTPTFE